MASLQPQLPAGMQVAVIGMGDADEAHAIHQQYAPQTWCLLDQQRVAYQAFVVPRAGIREMFDVSVLKAAIDARREGFSAGQPAGGDVMQMPATFVIHRTGVISMAYYSRSMADHPADHIVMQAAEHGV